MPSVATTDRRQMGPELAPHQLKALGELRNGSILCGGVGTGKSRTALAYYLNKGEPYEDLYVITTAKKRDSLDWEQEAAAFGIGKARNATVAGVLHVDSWNNIGKYADVRGGFFIFDEQRLVGSGKWVKSFLKIAKANAWILLSATPGDTWLDYIPVFVANGFYPNRTAFKREHVVYSTWTKFPKVERYLSVSKLVRYRNQLLVEMPYERHTRRHGKLINVDFDNEVFQLAKEKRWNPYENRPIREITELFSVMRRIVNSDPSRLEKLQQLAAAHPRLIVFYNFDYELQLLRSLFQATAATTASESTTTTHTAAPIATSSSRELSIPNSIMSSTPTPISGSSFRVAEWNGHKHEPIPDTDRWVYLVQYRAGAEGWNCIATDAMVFYSLTYSYRDFEQAHGRIDRLNTPFTDLYYFVLRSNSWIDMAVWKALKAKKNFNERKSGFDMPGLSSRRQI